MLLVISTFDPEAKSWRHITQYPWHSFNDQGSLFCRGPECEGKFKRISSTSGAGKSGGICGKT